ncbi:MAG TPA: response regulator transcription factor [Gemmataceae bacterium]|jgi:CheY-like chemotaxis protein|nr:response regulator transcription factor [Gemmataceae bacterium]
MDASRPAGKNILIVEDEDSTRDMLAMLLEDEGYAVTQAANGHEALDRLRSQDPPRVILLDLMMPVMDGWMFRRIQKQDPVLASIPVVIVSAAGEVGQQAVALSAASYLQKPIEPNHLLATIRRLCC